MNGGVCTGWQEHICLPSNPGVCRVRKKQTTIRLLHSWEFGTQSHAKLQLARLHLPGCASRVQLAA